MSKLQGVADTLYIPLIARIQISKRFPSFFYDEAALSLEKELPENGIEKGSGEYFYMASVCRYHVMDQMVEAFMKKHEKCNVVYLGAGLETAYWRLKPQNAIFYEMDLPSVIETRRRVLGESDNERLIAGDLFDFAWAKEMDTTLPTLLIASGVFQYFDEARIGSFIAEAKKQFEKGELLFDAMNGKAIGYANRYVRKTGNKDAEMHFWVDDPSLFAQKWDITLLAQKPFFTDARTQLKKQLSLYTRIAMWVVDEGSRRGYILHFGLNKERN